MKIDVLHKDWLSLSGKYFDDKNIMESLWEKIVENYSGKNRYYHNLSHIQSMFKFANNDKMQIVDFDCLLFV